MGIIEKIKEIEFEVRSDVLFNEFNIVPWQSGSKRGGPAHHKVVNILSWIAHLADVSNTKEQGDGVPFGSTQSEAR